MRGVVRFLIALIVILAIAYLGAWWYVQGRMAVAIRQQEQALRAAGWTVTHGTTARGTSPLAATYTVQDIAFTPPDQGVPRPTITLPQLSVKVALAAPFTLDIGLPLAWHIAMSQGPAFTLRFATLHDDYQIDPNALLGHKANPLRSGTIRFTGMRLDSAETNFTLISIASYVATGHDDPDAGTHATALMLHQSLKGLALSPIFVTLGHVPFDGKLAALRVDIDLSGPKLPAAAPTAITPATTPAPTSPQQAWQKLGPMIHDWAKAGGHGSFAIALDLGPLKAHDHGSFRFDATPQPQGKMTLTGDGVGEFLGDIASAYPQTVGIVSLLTAQSAPYMSKTPTGHQRLTVDFALADGILTANGKKVAHVPPVVWPPAR